MGTSINHLGEVRLFITRYKPEAQCRDIQISENCVPKGRDIYSELTQICGAARYGLSQVTANCKASGMEARGRLSI